MLLPVALSQSTTAASGQPFGRPLHTAYANVPGMLTAAAAPGDVVRVRNLATGQVQEWVGLTPEQAVTAAYWQARGDFNTWDYDRRETPLRHGRHVVFAGDFAAFVDRVPLDGPEGQGMGHLVDAAQGALAPAASGPALRAARLARTTNRLDPQRVLDLFA